MDKNILTKKPFFQLAPELVKPQYMRSLDPKLPRQQRNRYVQLTQDQFLRWYDPAAHDINSTLYYPDIVRYDEEKDRYYKEYRFRASFPFQRIICIQQLVHLCGNDLHHELTGNHNTKQEIEAFMRMKTGWLDKNMEIAFYQLARGVKKLADAAIVCYIYNGKFYWKPLAYDFGDTLFPHYGEDGQLETFARMYDSYDAKGEQNITYVEVWDKQNLTRYKRDRKGFSGMVNDLKEYFGLDGFSVDMQPTPHGFNEVPIVYHRDDDGPCYIGSQSAIDKYELAVSHLCQNNMAYAFPIMVLSGDSIDIKADMYGAVKAIDAGVNGKAEYLEPSGNSQSFQLQLETLLKMIFQGSFAVLPPEVRSGDMPGVSIKLIYSPSIDKAIVDCKEYDLSIDKLVRLFKWGYGIEIGAPRELANLGTYTWAEPYVHQNMTELVNQLVQLTNAGLLSRSTGCTLTGLGANNEEDKIIMEYKQQQAADLLYDLKSEGNDTTGTA